MIELDKAKVNQAFAKLKISRRELERRTGLNFRTIAKALDTGHVMPGKLQMLAAGLEVDALSLFKR